MSQQNNISSTGEEPKPAILLVDDEPDTLMLVSYSLERAGFEVLQAETGPQALEKIRHYKPDLAILDRMLPGMDGIELLHEIRQLYPDLLVIMLTAMSSEKDRLEGWEAGVDDYVVKPVNFKELIYRVRARLRRSFEAENREPGNGRNISHPASSDKLLVRSVLAEQTQPHESAGQSTFLPELLTAEDRNQISEARRIQAILLKASRAAQSEDYDRARELYSQTLELDPKNEIALKWLAYHTTDPHEGCKYLEKLIEVQPGNVKAHKLLEAGRRRIEELDRQSFNSIMSYLNNHSDHVEPPISNRPAVAPRRKLGQILVERGYISRENIETAASLQEIFRRSGEPKKLGEILTEYGYLTEEQLQRVLKEQEG